MTWLLHRSVVGNVSSVGEGGVTKVTRTGGGGFSLLCAANSLSMDGDSVPYTVAENGASDTLQARALHDYHAGDMRELSLATNEVWVDFIFIFCGLCEQFLSSGVRNFKLLFSYSK